MSALLQLVTAPTAEPVTLPQAKAHLRVDADDQAAYITALISAARQYVENVTGRQLMTATYDWKLFGFPDTWRPAVWQTANQIELPLSPIQSVTSIAYLDVNGLSTVWSSALYSLATDWVAAANGDRWMRPARITLAYNESWPGTRDIEGAVTIRFVAGYGAAAAVPEPLKLAVKMLVSHWYEQREPIVTGTIIAPVPMSVETLLQTHTVLSA